MKGFLILAAAVATFGIACNTTADDILPLTVGNTWTNTGYVLRNSGIASLDTIQTMSIVSTVMQQETLFSGERVFPVLIAKSVHLFSPDSNFVVASYQYLREVGGAVLMYDSLGDADPDTMLYQDLTVGRTWQGRNGYTTEVMGKGNLTVPAGVYDGAYRVKYIETTQSGSTYPLYVCFATGVGEVMRDYEAPLVPFGTKGFHTELTSVTIK